MTDEEFKSRLAGVNKEAPAEEAQDPSLSLNTSITEVMKSYQDANRWLDIIKEDLLINKGTFFFSEYIHNLAHTMPVRFDAFGDILHTANILVPYPPTEDIPYSLEDIPTIFKAIFDILSRISKSLREFIEITGGTKYHSISCKSEELLIDIDTEFENLHRMRKAYDICQDPMKFDKYLHIYLNR